jgi:hypothetical protein
LTGGCTAAKLTAETSLIVAGAAARREIAVDRGFGAYHRTGYCQQNNELVER